MSRNTYSGPNAGVGMASVIMIALVLALTTFGILSLVSARADAAMSRKARENAEAYYEAEEGLPSAWQIWTPDFYPVLRHCRKRAALSWRKR